MENLRKDLKEKRLNKCYVLFGKETYLRDKYEKLIVQEFDHVDKDMNISIFNTDIDINNLIDAVETLPFFAEKRLVVVKDSKLFKQGKKNDSERLADYIENVPSSTCLVFIEDEVDKRGRLYKAIGKSGSCVEFNSLSEAQLIQWVNRELKKYKVLIDEQTAMFFLHYVGEGMDNIFSELEKLASYKNEGEIVTKADIEEMCVKSLEIRIFELVAAIGERNTKTAVSLYKNMIAVKESPIMILTMIGRQFRLMLQCKVMESEGVAKIAGVTGQKEFVVKKTIAQSKNFTRQRLKKALETCLEADVAIKTGKVKDEVAVELIIVEYGS